MEKSIYIIKNDINNKVYIGQSKNPQSRFSAHCYPSNEETYIDKIINEIGKEHFWIEILEENVEDFNEKEKYWIKYYNSLFPNGYNISEGGGQPSTSLTWKTNPKAKIKDLETLMNIIHDLRETKLQYKEIQEKYSVEGKTIICKINSGEIYRIEGLDYPIRKERADAKITKNEVEEIKRLIKETPMTFSEIAKKYNISKNYIGDINRGILQKEENCIYPLRPAYGRHSITDEKQLREIIYLLLNTKLSIEKIAERFGVRRDTIIGIKNGTTKAYKRKEYNYPLRPNKFKKPVSTISAKESTTTIDT